MHRAAKIGMLKPLKQIRAVKKDHRKGRLGEDKCLDGSTWVYGKNQGE